MAREPASDGDAGASGIDWIAWVAERREVFEGRPSLNAHLTLHLEEARAGWVRMTMPLRPELMNPFGAVHGGSIAALIDSAAGSAIASGTLPDDRIMGTIDMQVHFLERGSGNQLTAEARIVRAGGAIAVAHVDVTDDAGALVAIGTATFRLAAPGTRRHRNED